MSVSAVLEQVNAIRVACGALPLDDLRPGRSGDAMSCPVANSLKDVIPGVAVSSSGIGGVPRERAGAVATVLGTKVEGINGKATVAASSAVRDFVKKFDAGRDYSQYRG